MVLKPLLVYHCDVRPPLVLASPQERWICPNSGEPRPPTEERGAGALLSRSQPSQCKPAKPVRASGCALARAKVSFLRQSCGPAGEAGYSDMVKSRGVVEADFNVQPCLSQWRERRRIAWRRIFAPVAMSCGAPVHNYSKLPLWVGLYSTSRSLARFRTFTMSISGFGIGHGDCDPGSCTNASLRPSLLNTADALFNDLTRHPQDRRADTATAGNTYPLPQQGACAPPRAQCIPIPRPSRQPPRCRAPAR
jgi:hypothetical protein